MRSMILNLPGGCTQQKLTSCPFFQEAIDRVMIGRTTLVVAHRLSTVRDMDQIAVMQGGSVANVGKHAELMERCPVYQNLVRRQT